VTIEERAATSGREDHQPRPGTKQPAVAARRAQVDVVDDDPITRDALAWALGQAGYEVGAAAPSVESVPVAGHCKAVVCDLHLRGRSGAQAVAYLVERGFTVLATSSAASGREILDAVSAGARGFTSKTAPAAHLARAVERVLEGRVFVDPVLAQLLLDSSRTWPLAGDDIGPREEAILRDLEHGDLVEEVADDLDLGEEELWGLLERVWDAERSRGRLRRDG
jgi:DNA-binding NarL/FixJ family response regulator